MEHSRMFNQLKYQYSLGYVAIETIKGRVELYKTKPLKGITEDEYKEITGIEYEA